MRPRRQPTATFTAAVDSAGTRRAGHVSPMPVSPLTGTVTGVADVRDRINDHLQAKPS
ncbi:hypothetical protein ACIBKY_44430 [Nonomuraea sp. NPDC050394]|uniref:hypothetical protein n=1 Tax=Nonomuraea sp. NPDC050394 TaxID=3364363 RepID=UPI0037A21E0F